MNNNYPQNTKKIKKSKGERQIASFYAQEKKYKQIDNERRYNLSEYINPTKKRKPINFKLKDTRVIKISDKEANNQSISERIIANYLRNNNIRFYIEKSFKNLINPITRQKLRFDFYLPDFNSCIEYDGLQHYSYVPKFHGIDAEEAKEQIRKQQYRDGVKDRFCKERGIKLLRICYKDRHIESILKSNFISPLNN